MLDYLYFLWDENNKPITAENAVVMHYFGRYFEIPGLRKEARIFWKNNMNVLQAGTYLEQAKIFHDHKENLNAETFLKLTDESVLPKLSAEATMKLLQLESVFVPTSASASELSSLQARGLEALISCSDKDYKGLQCCFKDLPPLVISQMLQRSISKLRDFNNDPKVTMSCAPKEVDVSHAGVDEVNGTYSRTTNVGTMAPSYVMDGTWKGSPAKFELCMHRWGQYVKPRWYISLYLQESIADIFYGASASEENPRLPPKLGWYRPGWPLGKRTGTVPHLSYRFDEF